MELERENTTMAIIRNFIVGIAAISIATPVITTTAFADEGHPTMSMISTFEVDPSKSEQFDKSWKIIRDFAIDSDYAYTDFVGGNRNQRWIATPVHDFSDVDALFAARKAVSDGAGKKFTKALEQFTAAMTSSHTFFTTEDADLSYSPDGAAPGSYMEIDTYYYRYGAKDKMTKVLADYKALMEAKNSPYAYQVSWDGIGSTGNSVTIIGYADNAVAIAEANAAVEAMLEGDDTFEHILADFLAINTGSETTHTTFDPEASIMRAQEE
jgi:hypothetical protein